MAKAKRKTTDSWKLKEYYDVLAPKIFGEAKVGETLSSNPADLVGRTVETTMRDITGDFSKQHIKLTLKVDELKGNKAHTRFIRQSLSRDYMRSQIRRKTTRVEGVTDVYTKDGYRLRVKTIALAIGRAQTAQERLIRKTMFEVIKEEAGAREFAGLIQEVVQGGLASRIQKRASKIYPLKRVEIRKTKVLEEPGRAGEKPAEEKAEKPKVEKAKRPKGKAEPKGLKEEEGPEKGE